MRLDLNKVAIGDKLFAITSTSARPVKIVRITKTTVETMDSAGETASWTKRTNGLRGSDDPSARLETLEDGRVIAAGMRKKFAERRLLVEFSNFRFEATSEFAAKLADLAKRIDDCAREHA